MTVLRLPLTCAALVLLPIVARAQDVPPAIRTAAACAPVGVSARDDAPRVVALPSADKMPFAQSLFSPGQRVAIDRGTEAGVRSGERYVVRRPMRFFGAPRAQHTIGWLRVIDATANAATAEIDFACDAIAVGDRVEPAADLVLPAGIARTATGGTLDMQQAMKVSYGSDGRSVQGDRDFVLADRGSARGVVAGARYAVFHRSASPDGNQAIAEAVVVSVYPEQSLLRVTSVHEPVFAGDQLVMRVGATESASTPAYERSSAAERLPDPPSRPADALASPAAPATDSPAARASGDRHLTFEDLYFGLDRASLRPEARKLLDEAVKALKDDPSLRVQIEGHTCSIGTAEYNLVLGQRRADVVKAYLVGKGIAENRLSTASYGEEKPAHDNNTEEGRRLNRRAVLTVNLQK